MSRHRPDPQKESTQLNLSVQRRVKEKLQEKAETDTKGNVSELANHIFLEYFGMAK